MFVPLQFQDASGCLWSVFHTFGSCSINLRDLRNADRRAAHIAQYKQGLCSICGSTGNQGDVVNMRVNSSVRGGQPHKEIQRSLASGICVWMGALWWQGERSGPLSWRLWHDLMQLTFRNVLESKTGNTVADGCLNGPHPTSAPECDAEKPSVEKVLSALFLETQLRWKEHIPTNLTSSRSSTRPWAVPWSVLRYLPTLDTETAEKRDA